MPSKRATGGPPCLGHTWSRTQLEADGLMYPEHCAALEHTCAGRGANPRSSLERAGGMAVM